MWRCFEGTFRFQTFVGKSDIPVDSSSGNVGDNLFCVRYTDDFPTVGGQKVAHLFQELCIIQSTHVECEQCEVIVNNFLFVEFIATIIRVGRVGEISDLVVKIWLILSNGQGFCLVGYCGSLFLFIHSLRHSIHFLCLFY